MIQSLIREIKDNVDQAVVMLRLNVNTDKKLMKSLEKIFKNNNNEILKRLRETADSLTYKWTTNNVLILETSGKSEILSTILTGSGHKSLEEPCMVKY